MKKYLPILSGALVLLLIVLSQTLYTVHQTQMAIRLQLGAPVGDPVGPGIHLKLPFVQNVLRFDIRILNYDARQAEIITSDKKTLVVDNYARWRIVDPLKFYRTVRNLNGAQARLDDVIYSQTRVALGQFTLTEIVSSKRSQIMQQITDRSSQLISEYGIELLDVRIKRTDLPAENQRAIYGRMRTERERQAKQYRSEGQEESVKIRSGADRERVVILAEAQRKAEILRGGGDAEATRIYAEAFNQSPDFYAFKRSLDAYIRGLAANTRLILTPESPFFRFLR